MPLTFEKVKANLLKAGYRITVYGSNEGALQIDATHKAQAGLSIGYSPDGSQLYAAVFETHDPAVRAAVVSHNSDETTPFVRGELVFTISGTAPELARIVRDAGDALPSTVQAGPQGGTGSAAIRETLQRFIDVYAAGHEKAVCASFTPQALRRSETFCDPRSIFYKRTPDPRVKHYTIIAASTNGDGATATISFAGTSEQLALRRLGGQWKIDTPLGAGHLF